MGLYKAACCCKINGNVCDLRTPLHEDCELAICTFDDEDGKKTFWHTSSHLLAQAVKQLFPEAKLAIGPAIDNGFYYDFDVKEPFSAEDLEKIEALMKKNAKSNPDLVRLELPPEQEMCIRDRLYTVRISVQSSLPTFPSIIKADCCPEPLPAI